MKLSPEPTPCRSLVPVSGWWRLLFRDSTARRRNATPSTPVTYIGALRDSPTSPSHESCDWMLKLRPAPTTTRAPSTPPGRGPRRPSGTPPTPTADDHSRADSLRRSSSPASPPALLPPTPRRSGRRAFAGSCDRPGSSSPPGPWDPWTRPAPGAWCTGPGGALAGSRPRRCEHPAHCEAKWQGD